MSYWPDDQRKDKKQERRRGPDKMSQWLRFSSFLSWLFLALVIVLNDAARPSKFSIYVLDSKWNKTSTTYVRTNYINAAAVFCLITFVFSLTNLIIDATRKRRKADRHSISLMLAMICSFIGLIAFSVYYLL